MDLNKKLTRIGSHILCLRGKSDIFRLGHENVLRAPCLSRIGSHPSPLAQFGQCFPWSSRRLEMPFRVLFSTRTLVKSIKNDEFHDM